MNNNAHHNLQVKKQEELISQIFSETVRKKIPREPSKPGCRFIIKLHDSTLIGDTNVYNGVNIIFSHKVPGLPLALEKKFYCRKAFSAKDHFFANEFAFSAMVGESKLQQANDELSAALLNFSKHVKADYIVLEKRNLDVL